MQKFPVIFDKLHFPTLVCHGIFILISPSKISPSIICFSKRNIQIDVKLRVRVKCWTTREASRIARRNHFRIPDRCPDFFGLLCEHLLNAGRENWRHVQAGEARVPLGKGGGNWTVGSDRCSERRKAADGQKGKEKLIVFKGGGGGGGIFT